MIKLLSSDVFRHLRYLCPAMFWPGSIAWLSGVAYPLIPLVDFLSNSENSHHYPVIRKVLTTLMEISYSIMPFQSLNFWSEHMKICSSFYGSNSFFFSYSIFFYARSRTTKMITELSNLKTGKHWWVAETIIVSPLIIFNYS